MAHLPNTWKGKGEGGKRETGIFSTHPHLMHARMDGVFIFIFILFIFINKNKNGDWDWRVSSHFNFVS